MKIELVWVNDDWTELYIDGSLAMDGHSLPVSAVIRAVAPGADFSERHVNRCIYCEKELPTATPRYVCGECTG